MNFVIAENYLCFYALLETVISGFGISSYSQYDFTNEFGVVLPHGHSIPKINNISYYIYTYSYGSLYHEPQNYMVGHVALLLNCLSNEKLEIYDPGPRKYGIKVVNRIAMHEAMEDIRGGTYVIEPISSDFLPC